MLQIAERVARTLQGDGLETVMLPADEVRERFKAHIPQHALQFKIRFL